MRGIKNSSDRAKDVTSQRNQEQIRLENTWWYPPCKELIRILGQRRMTKVHTLNLYLCGLYEEKRPTNAVDCCQIWSLPSSAHNRLFIMKTSWAVMHSIYSSYLPRFFCRRWGIRVGKDRYSEQSKATIAWTEAVDFWVSHSLNLLWICRGHIKQPAWVCLKMLI